MVIGGKKTPILCGVEDFKNPTNLLFGLIYPHFGGVD